MQDVPWSGGRRDIPATAVRWVDDEPFPGIVLVRFGDDERHEITDKCVIFAGDLAPDSPYPTPTAVTCDVLEVDGETALVRLTWSETDAGLTEIRVPLGLNPDAGKDALPALSEGKASFPA
ncbi:hypothetical protein [Kutzneria buriramensis]|uniref:Uncharacterized protein n=1 Tax=Kutzneria buriramensis TaxID=1045776 RepID=A0A3E0HP25_9PSEU|nr:hypothetical protein [Kutzneria buriramensis]REH48272.1 hypothetical protein BCF44_105130 [Kutzneria buriramensis]